MSRNKLAVIIGAGIGGIATSIFLARNGYEVHVYEKNPFPGGRCGQITRDGHRFDLGATIFLMPSIYRHVFDLLGIKLEDCLETSPLETIYKIHFDDNTELAFTTDTEKMRSQMESIETGSFPHFEKYISGGYEFFEIAMSKLLGQNYYKPSEFVTFKNVIRLIKLKSYIRHHKYVGKFFRHAHLKMAFTFQNIYVGQSPFQSPALFSMLPAVELTEGSLFPTGGMYNIVTKLITIAKEAGVKFNYSKPVKRMNLSNNKVKSIMLEDGAEIAVDLVVANADLPYVYHELLPDKNLSLALDRKQYSCSAIVFHWGLDKVYPQLEHHNVFLSEDYKNNLDQIFNKKSLSEKPSFYAHAPVRTDPSAAPANQDSLSVIVPVGHVDNKHNQDWNTLKQIARTGVIERLKNKGMTDIEKHIKFEICYLPNTWESIYNISRGSVFGSLGHNIMQMGYFRPHNRHDDYKNLYFVGGSTHPGNGVPLVLMSAKLTSERILKESRINEVL